MPTFASWSIFRPSVSMRPTRTVGMHARTSRTSRQSGPAPLSVRTTALCTCRCASVVGSSAWVYVCMDACDEWRRCITTDVGRLVPCATVPHLCLCPRVCAYRHYLLGRGTGDSRHSGDAHPDHLCPLWLCGVQPSLQGLCDAGGPQSRRAPVHPPTHGTRSWHRLHGCVVACCIGRDRYHSQMLGMCV
jgi:hypothetical protein